MNLKFPLQFDQSGKTATVNDERHIREMIEQVLFTSPGERVNRPAFGSGLMQLTFEPNSNELAATTKFLLQSSLQKWLGDIIEVDDVTVENEEETLVVTVVYTNRVTRKVTQTTFTR